MGRDKISREKRSHIMSSIGSKNTKIELKLRRALWKKGHRYSIHKKMPGNPDIVFSKGKVAVFVDGDFWHGYDFQKLKPKLKDAFWLNKITRNIERDKEVTDNLKKQGWMVVRLWEHQVNKDPEGCIKKIERRL